MTKKDSEMKRISLESTDLDELRSTFREIVDLADRQHGFPTKSYESCFVGMNRLM